MEKLFIGLGVAMLAIAVVALMSFILGFPIMWLWNWLCPVIFGLPKISFWQAVGLFFLSNILVRNSNSNSGSK